MLYFVEQEYKAAEEQKASLQAIIDAQSIHPEDVERMKSEKSSLQRTLDALHQNKEEWAQGIKARESELFQKHDTVRVYIVLLDSKLIS